MWVVLVLLSVRDVSCSVLEIDNIRDTQEDAAQRAKREEKRAVSARRIHSSRHLDIVSPQTTLYGKLLLTPTLPKASPVEPLNIPVPYVLMYEPRPHLFHGPH